jgi:hypothetical protein
LRHPHPSKRFHLLLCSIVCQHSTVRCLWQAHITFYCACAQSSDGSFSVEKQSVKYNLCRAVAIINHIKLMGKNDDMRLRAFICYGLNVQSLHRWIQVLRQNEVRAATRNSNREKSVVPHCAFATVSPPPSQNCVRAGPGQEVFRGLELRAVPSLNDGAHRRGLAGVLRVGCLVCTAAMRVATPD